MKDQYKATAIEVLCRAWQLAGLKEVPASSARYIVIVSSAFSNFFILPSILFSPKLRLPTALYLSYVLIS